MANDALLDILKTYTQPAQQPAPPGVNQDDYTQATSMMQVKYGAPAQNLYDQYNQINQTLQTDVNAQQQYGQIADQRMADIGNQLHGQLQQGADATGAAYQAGAQKVGGLYDELSGDIGKQGNEVQDILQKQGQRTGQDVSAFSNPLGRIQASIAEMKARADLAKGNSVSNLMTLGAQMQGIAQSRVGSSDQEFAQKRADLTKQIAGNITKLQIQAMTDGGKTLRDLTQLAGQKAADLQATLLDLGNARTKNDLERLKLQLDQDYKQADLALRAKEAVNKATGNALDDQYKRLQIEKLGKELDTEPMRYISLGEGMTNLNDALDKMQRTTPARSKMSDADIAGGKLTYSQIAGIKRWINENVGTATALNANISPAQALLNLAMGQAKNGTVKLPKGPDAKKGFKYDVDVSTLINLLGTAFTNVGSPSKTGTIIPGGSKG